MTIGEPAARAGCNARAARFGEWAGRRDVPARTRRALAAALSAAVLLAGVCIAPRTLAQQLGGPPVYRQGADGQPLQPPQPASPVARRLVAQFTAARLPHLTQAEDLVAYLPLGGGHYLLEAASPLPAANGVFLADTRAGRVQALLLGDYSLVASTTPAPRTTLIVLRASAGDGSLGSTTVKAVLATHGARGRVDVATQTLAAVRWDRVAGLCGTTLQAGTAGDIRAVAVQGEGDATRIRINTLAQDCASRVVTDIERVFVLQGGVLRAVP